VSFVTVNQRKHMVALDLHHDHGRAALLELIGRADVFVDNLRPASLASLGLDEHAIASTNPKLVRASVSAFGHDGSWAEVPGFDPILQVLSGLAVAQGGEGDPVTTTAPVHDVATGALTAFGVVATLVARIRRGCGQWVVTSLTATSTFLQSAELTGFDGRPLPLVGGIDFAGAITHTSLLPGGRRMVGRVRDDRRATRRSFPDYRCRSRRCDQRQRRSCSPGDSPRRRDGGALGSRA